jgi:hypothetical protein
MKGRVENSEEGQGSGKRSQCRSREDLWDVSITLKRCVKS